MGLGPLRQFRQAITGLCALLLLIAVNSQYVYASNGAYGDGAYGSCSYGTCSIGLSTNGTVEADVLPTSGTSCSVQKDSVGITTDSSTGYTLSLSDSGTNNSLSDGANSIAATNGTQSSPAVLTADTWGYRIDGVGGFGSGPTSAVSNVAPPGLTFALVPLSSSGPNTLVNSSGPADPTVTTSVWYGVCASSSTPTGTYSNVVTYTAIIN